MKNIIIFGPMGSGKTTLAHELAKLYNGHTVARVVSLGKAIRQVCDFVTQGQAVSREYLQQVGQGMRGIFGADVWSINLTHRLDDFIDTFYRIPTLQGDPPQLFFIIDDGRQFSEYQYWTKQGFLTIGISAPKEVRAERLFDRDKVDQTGYMDFENEVSALQMAGCCDMKVENEGSLEELQRKAAMVYSYIKSGEGLDDMLWVD